ncbi:hypothetical protein L2Y94_18780 [Luteibacter aegosomatis]|uniref:hypothetical protein n=1 Tax=Luteibacter aegosomatis TaxID=2911537 RepID=UPI001FFA706D|nr:hypothetical protein [Luteibacter aegosomatis]UPG85325.1 hypothetical protein L2Y94_18780 [Luteibacter aegosomatis]
MRTLSALLLASLIAVPFSANAQQAISGLGQSWPNATDVSSSPNYHVYVFQRGNTRYIQVNDANGNVRGAFARTPYSLVGLPIGTAELATPDEPMPAPASTAGETVYQGNSITVFAAPQPDGTMRLMAAPVTCAEHPVECTGAFR